MENLWWCIMENSTNEKNEIATKIFLFPYNRMNDLTLFFFVKNKTRENVSGNERMYFEI